VRQVRTAGTGKKPTPGALRHLFQPRYRSKLCP